MKKQNGIVLLEVLIAVTIMGFVMLYVSKIQSEQVTHQARTLSAAKISKLYQLTTDVMFEPAVRRKDSADTDGISDWSSNDTINYLQRSLSPSEGYIYLDVEKTSNNTKIANFFNGLYFDDAAAPGKSSCAADIGVYSERVNCTSGLEDEFNIGIGYKVKGIKVDGDKSSFFSINNIESSDVSNVKPTSITIFIDGLHNREGLKDIYDLAESASEKVSQINDINNSAYADIHIANYADTNASSYDTGINANEALIDSSISINGDMGLAIVFPLTGTQELRSDGMIAMQNSRSLCWNVSSGGVGDEYICQSAISSSENSNDGENGNGEFAKFLMVNGNVIYQTTDQKTTEKHYRTPVEVIVESFKNHNDIEIAKPVCPKVENNILLPYLSVVGSSYSNSDYGEFPDVDNDDYGDNSISNTDKRAELISGVLFRWSDQNEFWNVKGIIASPNYSPGEDVINPSSVQITALRWCEAK